MGKLLSALLGIMLIGLVSCNDDGRMSYSEKPMTNASLMQVLKQKGYTFNNEGKLELNELVQQTTSLDLSGTQLTDFTGLDVLPNLTDLNLQNNGYKMSFDLSSLPTQITGIDLRGNEIYELKGLAKVDVAENGEESVTVQHSLKKLILPESAKYNQEEILGFYEKNRNEIEKGGIEMQMLNKGGKLEKYNTLREVPDDSCRKQLRESFPSLFAGDKIDISKRIVNVEEKSRDINIHDAKSAEGIQYVIHNRSYAGLTIGVYTTEPNAIPYLKMSAYLTNLQLDNVNTPNGIDFSRCKVLTRIVMMNNKNIKTIDLSASQKLGQRSLEDELGTTDSWLIFEQCNQLENIKIPVATKIIGVACFTNLPSLKSLNLSQIECLNNLQLLGISVKVIYPNLQYFSADAKKIDNEKGYAMLVIDEERFNKPETKEFVDKYKKNLKSGYPSVFSPYIQEPLYFDWKKALQ